MTQTFSQIASTEEIDASTANTESPAKSVFVIFNPVSGQTDPEERKKLISDALAVHGYTSQFIATSREQGAKELAVQALKDGVDLLAVSGGDGTVMEAMSALVGTKIPIAVLPAGTGNLLSINLGIPITVPDAVFVALSGRPYALDLAKTSEGRYFAIMGGMGMDAQMIADTDREAKNKLGKWAYFQAAFKNLPRRRAFIDIILDDKPPLRRRAKTVLLANMGKITGGLSVLPTATPDDGLLDVGILKAATVAHWVHLMGSTLLGRAHEDASLEVHQAKKVTLRPRHSQPVQFDGEDGGETKSLTVEIVPHAVYVLLPKDAPALDETPPLSAVEAVAQTVTRSFLVPGIVIGLAVGAFVLWRSRGSRR
ncbi:MAG: diacylglycerol/lipid kinase family protein [Janthinobacterium lividum]